MSTRAFYTPWGRYLDIAQPLSQTEYREVIGWHGRIRRNDTPVFVCETSGASMYVRRHTNGRHYLVHFGGDGHGSHPVTAPMSDAHKRQREYVFESATSSGLRAAPEYRTSGGTIVDVAVSGTGNVAVELQVSPLTTAKALSRTYATATSDDFPSAPLWLDTSPAQRTPQYMRFVPSARGVTTGWETQMPVRGSAEAVVATLTPAGRTLDREPKRITYDDLIVKRAMSQVVAVEHPNGGVSMALRGGWCDGVMAGDFPGFKPWVPRPTIPARKETPQVWSRACGHSADKYQPPPHSGTPALPQCPCGRLLFHTRPDLGESELCAPCRERRSA